LQKTAEKLLTATLVCRKTWFENYRRYGWKCRQ